MGWQVYGLTHDPLSLGLIGLAEALPFIGFALPAGHLADRTSRLALVRSALGALTDLFGRAALLHRSTRHSSSRPRVADLRRDLLERHRAQLSPALAHRAQRRARAPIAVSQCRHVAQLHLAARGGSRPCNWRSRVRFRQRDRRIRGRCHAHDPRPGGDHPHLPHAGVARRDRRVDRRESGRRCPLRPWPAGDSRCAHTRSLLGPLRRGHRAPSGLCGRDPPRRTAGTRPSARGAGGGRGADVARPRAPPTSPARGPNAVCQCGDVRRDDDRLRAVSKLSCSR